MRIGIVAPSRGLTRDAADRVLALAARDFPQVSLVIHPQCFLRDGHFAGADEVRAAAFVEMANDPAIDALWFARGGYGANRLLDAVMPALGAAARAKTYLGYSDGGFLLAALYQAGIGWPVHGPMVADIAREGGAAAAARALEFLRRSDGPQVPAAPAAAPAIALNLTILATLIGTRWLPDLAGHVLMIEEVAEPLYRIDRMLFQLASAPALRGVCGIRLGRVTDVVANDPPWGEPVEQMIARCCALLGVPYLGRCDIGHDVDNSIVPFGQPAPGGATAETDPR